MTTAPLAFIDTETDGIHPDRRVWEVAIIRREPDGTEREWRTYVDIDLSTSDPFGLRVGRFYDRHPLGRKLSGATTADERWTSTTLPTLHTARKVAEMTHGAHLVGAVPNFDAEVLALMLRDHELAPAWHYHLIDVEALAVGYLANADSLADRALATPPWDSDDLNFALGLPNVDDADRHTALGDARWARTMYDRIVGR